MPKYSPKTPIHIYLTPEEKKYYQTCIMKRYAFSDTVERLIHEGQYAKERGDRYGCGRVERLTANITDDARMKLYQLMEYEDLPASVIVRLMLEKEWGTVHEEKR